MTEQQFVKLRRRGDQLVVYPPGRKEAVPARIVWARPLTGPGGVASILHASKKEEIAILQSFDHLDETSRGVLEEELQRRYFLPSIIRVIKTKAAFGNRYWDVETDCGPRQFLMKSPETNATWLTDDHCILRDTLGNCYEIESIEKLDPESRAKAQSVL